MQTEHNQEQHSDDPFVRFAKLFDMEIDDLFTVALEEEAAKLEITVDYYMEEFM